jgi:pimeloyl-ACP methyl ester carboxylesterase
LLINAGLYDGMFYAVTCSEDAPLISPDEAASHGDESVFGDRTTDFLAICQKWPKGTVSPTFREPVRSDIPVLILSGEADPITPPWHANKVAENLTNEIHLILPGMGHGNLTSRCTMNIFKDFIDRASIAGLNTSCVKGIQPPPFFVNFSGPRP